MDHAQSDGQISFSVTNNEINIRDPFVLCENGVYYLYGTRGRDFGMRTGGFDVYIGTDLAHWSAPQQVFDSALYGMNDGANWAPEVHRFRDRYYMFATFTQPNGRRGTYSLVADNPCGPFSPTGKTPLTPQAWESLDGTLWIEDGKPYLVFCHEHVQILNGTVCCMEVTEDLASAASEPKLLFKGSDAYGVPENQDGRYVTDGPFLYRAEDHTLFMIWSTCPPTGYYQGLCVSESGRVDGPWTQLPPLYTRDGGHGMLFRDNAGKLFLTLHTPNRSLEEHPAFFPVREANRRLDIRT